MHLEIKLKITHSRSLRCLLTFKTMVLMKQSVYFIVSLEKMSVLGCITPPISRFHIDLPSMFAL